MYLRQIQWAPSMAIQQMMSARELAVGGWPYIMIHEEDTYLTLYVSVIHLSFKKDPKNILFIKSEIEEPQCTEQDIFQTKK